MSKIFTGTHDKELEFTANKDLDAARRQKNGDGSMTFVSINLSVLGNSAGRNKTMGQEVVGSTGGSFQALYGSEYCVADLTIPFEWGFGKANMTKIMGKISSIQTKLSKQLTKIQGTLTPEQEETLRDSAMRSQAIREAKEEIRTNGDDDFDQNTFNKSNAGVRAGVMSDMSLNAGIECSAAVGINSEEAKSARDRGWRTAAGESGILTFRTKEKGLKSVYLMDSDRVIEAQNYVYEIGSQIQKTVQDQIKSGWANEISLNILEKIDEMIKDDPNTQTKNIQAYTADELDRIRSYKQAIVKDYDSRMASFE